MAISHESRGEGDGGGRMGEGGGDVKSTPVEHSSDKAAINVQSYYGGDLENPVLPQHFHSKL